MNILLSTDNNYVMPTGVLMHSIGINNSVKVHYYILINESLTEDNKKSLQKVADKYDNEIDFYVVGEEYTESLPFGRDTMPKHVSIATYYRLFITQILPEGVHKVIYLDGDMIVRKSLEALWNIDISNFALACVHDMDEVIHILSGRHRYPVCDFGYFNAGFIVINLDYWRKHDCSYRFADYITNHSEDIIMHDQDVLNTVLYKEKKWLPTTYNFQMGFLREGKNINYIDSIYDDIGRTMQDPTIIHYCTEDKPWQLYSYNPYLRVWRYYWSKSEWRKNKLEGEHADNIKHRITAFLFRKGLMVKKTGRLKVILKK